MSSKNKSGALKFAKYGALLILIAAAAWYLFAGNKFDFSNSAESGESNSKGETASSQDEKEFAAKSGADGDKRIHPPGIRNNGLDKEFTVFWEEFTSALASQDIKSLRKLTYKKALHIELSYDFPTSYSLISQDFYKNHLFSTDLDFILAARLHYSFFAKSYADEWAPPDCVYTHASIELMDNNRPLFKDNIDELVSKKEILGEMNLKSDTPVYIIDIATRINNSDYCRENIAGYPETNFQLFAAKIESDFKFIAWAFTPPE